MLPPYYLINTSILSLSLSPYLLLSKRKYFVQHNLSKKKSNFLVRLANNFFLKIFFISDKFFSSDNLKKKKKIYGEDKSIYLCKQKTKKNMSLNIGATSVGHGCQTPVNKTKGKFHNFFFFKKKKKTSNWSFKKKNKKTKQVWANHTLRVCLDTAYFAKTKNLLLKVL